MLARPRGRRREHRRKFHGLTGLQNSWPGETGDRKFRAHGGNVCKRKLFGPAISHNYGLASVRTDSYTPKVNRVRRKVQSGLRGSGWIPGVTYAAGGSEHSEKR